MLAHDVGGGALPAPPWLLGYLGAALVLGTATGLRVTWPPPRFAGTDRTPTLTLADPLGRGWDLFGTLTHTIDFSVLQSAWVGTTQLALLGVGHMGTVVLAHDVALRNLGRRAAMGTTWAMAVVVAASLIAATFLVLS